MSSPSFSAVEPRFVGHATVSTRHSESPSILLNQLQKSADPTYHRNTGIERTRRTEYADSRGAEKKDDPESIQKGMRNGYLVSPLFAYGLVQDDEQSNFIGRQMHTAYPICLRR